MAFGSNDQEACTVFSKQRRSEGYIHKTTSTHSVGEAMASGSMDRKSRRIDREPSMTDKLDTIHLSVPIRTITPATALVVLRASEKTMLQTGRGSVAYGNRTVNVKENYVVWVASPVAYAGGVRGLRRCFCLIAACMSS